MAYGRAVSREWSSTQKAAVAGGLFWLAFVMVLVGGTAAVFGWVILVVLAVVALIAWR